MITIFTCPKAFKGPFARIQENAIVSWTKLKPKCEIILIGNEKGVADTAKKYGLKHLPFAETSRQGTPIVSDIFIQAVQNATFPIIAYVNSDVILLSNFFDCLQKIKFNSFMAVGCRWELDIDRRINFDEDWRKKLAQELHERGKIKSNKAFDYFIFPKNLDLKIPPFIIGRWAWDNWFLYQAKKRKIPLIDATRVITAIHQNHDYSHAGGYQSIWLGEEHKKNLELTPDKRRSFNIANVDWVLSQDGCSVPPFSLYRLWRAVRVYPILHPFLKPFTDPFILGIQFLLDRFKK